jgi:hypothetical protein
MLPTPSSPTTTVIISAATPSLYKFSKLARKGGMTHFRRKYFSGFLYSLTHALLLPLAHPPRPLEPRAIDARAGTGHHDGDSGGGEGRSAALIEVFKISEVLRRAHKPHFFF